MATDLRSAVDAEHRKQEQEDGAGTPAVLAQHDEPAPPPDELRVDGTAQLGLFEAGGKRATSASVRLAGGKVGLVDGQAFRKGDLIRLEVTAVVDEVGQKDKADPQTGIVVSCEQKHVARITDLRILTD